MKLSEAMRLADELGYPDMRGHFGPPSTNPVYWVGEMPRCCAIGGANLAAGNTRLEVVEGADWKGYPPIRDLGLALDSVEGFDDDIWARRAPARCPAKRCSNYYDSIVAHGRVEHTIIHLYDQHDWSRTRIADWLDSIEAGAAR